MWLQAYLYEDFLDLSSHHPSRAVIIPNLLELLVVIQEKVEILPGNVHGQVGACSTHHRSAAASLKLSCFTLAPQQILESTSQGKWIPLLCGVWATCQTCPLEIQGLDSDSDSPGSIE